MKDQNKTKQKPIEELEALRKQVTKPKGMGTRRKQVEEALQESEATIRALIESPVDSILLVNPDGIILETNQTFAQRIGLCVDELIGRCIYDFLPPELVKSKRTRVDEIVNFGIPIRFEDERTGMQLDQSAHPIFDAQGKVTKIAIVARDITERKRAENELRKFKTISDKAGHGITIVDLEGNVSYVNTSFARMHGYASDELIGKHLSIFHTEQQMANVNRLREQLNQEGSYVAEEVWHKRNDNTEFPTLMNGTLVKDENGTPLFMAATAVDITERKRMEEAMQASETKYRIVADNTYDWEFWTSPEGRFLYTSPSCKRITGHAPDEFIADPNLFYRIVHPDDRPDFDRHKDEMTQKIAPYEVEFRVIRSDGAVRWIGHACQPVFAPDGHFLGMRGSNRDITERKRAEEAIRESEERFRRLSEASFEGIIFHEEGKIIDANEAFATMFGYGFSEVIGKNALDFATPELREKALSYMRDGSEEPYDGVAIQKDGSRFLVEVRGKNTPYKGRTVRLTAIRDITERKRAEEALRESKENFKALAENANDGLVIAKGEEGWHVYANRRAAEITGYPVQELLKTRIRDLAHPDELSKLTERYKERLAGLEVPKPYETVLLNKDGIKVPIEISPSKTTWQNQPADIVIFRDITERKQAEEVLRQSEEKYRVLTNNIPGVTWTTDRGGHTIFISPPVKEVYGYTPEEIYADHELWLGRVHPDDIERVMIAFESLFTKEERFDIEYRIHRKDGLWIWLHDRSFNVREKDGRRYADGLFTDITGRKQTEEVLRRKSGEQALLLDNIQTQVWYLTDEETYGAVNKARAEFFGKKNGEMENKKFYDVLGKDEADICMSGYVEAFKKRKQIHTEEWITNAKGEKRLLSIIKSPKLDENGDVEYVVCSAGDITERKRAEDEIKKMNKELERHVIERTAQLEATSKDMQKEITERKRAEEELKKHEERLEELVKKRTRKIEELERQRAEIEKLAAAGLMAARIAHEINNPLAGIKNSFMLVKDAIPQDHPYYKYVGSIDNEINRVARIVRQMFDIYRPEQEIKKEFSVDKTLYEVVVLLEAAWQENNITIAIDSKPITMEMPEGLLRQVLYNVLLNAIEASPQGGVVKIMTEVDNETLALLISDQGGGIPLEVHSRIFEPFFTSKHGSQKGLGLGLSVSKDIVEKLGGHIDFESEPGKGTLFRIVLPLKSGERR